MLMAPPPSNYGVNSMNRQATQLLGASGMTPQPGFGSPSVGGRPGFTSPLSTAALNVPPGQSPYQRAANPMVQALMHGHGGLAPHLPNGPAPMAGANPPMNYRPM